MGGRGSSSMSAGRDASLTISLDPARMGDGQLSAAVSQTREQLSDVGNRMEELAERIREARRSPREGRSERIGAAQRAYGEGSDLYDQLRDRLSALEDEQIRRRQASQPRAQRTFVNSYGEATRRNITSQSYESAQRRLNRRIESWMRGR